MDRPQQRLLHDILGVASAPKHAIRQPIKYGRSRSNVTASLSARLSTSSITARAAQRFDAISLADPETLGQVYKPGSQRSMRIAPITMRQMPSLMSAPLRPRTSRPWVGHLPSTNNTTARRRPMLTHCAAYFTEYGCSFAPEQARDLVSRMRTKGIAVAQLMRVVAMPAPTV